MNKSITSVGLKLHPHLGKKNLASRCFKMLPRQCNQEGGEKAKMMRGALEHMSGVRETNSKLNPIVLILIRAMFKNWACRPTICAMAWATPRTIPAGGMANFRSSGTQL